MTDLKRKSHALTNQLQPRNPVQIRNKSYYKHSEFGFHNFDKKNSEAKQRYEEMLMMLNIND